MHRDSKNLMGKLQLVDKKKSTPLNEMGKDTYCFSVLDRKVVIFIYDAKIKEKVVEIRTQFLGSKCRPFRKNAMPKSINH